MQNNRSGNRLDIILQKGINCHGTYAYPLCIILADERRYPWFYENYMEIYSLGNPCTSIDYMDGISYLSKNENAILHRKSIKRSEIEVQFDCIAFVRESIHSGNYLVMFLDEYYLQGQGAYQSFHYVHDTLVFGFDDYKKKIMAVAVSRNSDYVINAYDYEAFRNAFQDGLTHCSEAIGISPLQLEENTIILLKCREDREQALNIFDLNNFKDKLCLYVNANVYSETQEVPSVTQDHVDNKSFGFAVYDVFLQVFSNITEGVDFWMPPYQQFLLFFEHKKGILERLQFIANTQEITDESKTVLLTYRKVIEKFETIMRQYLKLINYIKYMKPANITDAHKQNYCKNITKSFQEVKIEEQECIKKILDYL